MAFDKPTVEAAEAVANQVIPAVIGFIPGGAVAVPFVQAALPFVEQAFNAIALNNGGNMFTALTELIQHVTPGQPNSPILSAPAPVAKPAG